MTFFIFTPKKTQESKSDNPEHSIRRITSIVKELGYKYPFKESNRLKNNQEALASSSN